LVGWLCAIGPLLLIWVLLGGGMVGEVEVLGASRFGGRKVGIVMFLFEVGIGVEIGIGVEVGIGVGIGMEFSIELFELSPEAEVGLGSVSFFLDELVGFFKGVAFGFHEVGEYECN
jgi:hypothetical protein